MSLSRFDENVEQNEMFTYVESLSMSQKIQMVIDTIKDIMNNLDDFTPEELDEYLNTYVENLYKLICKDRSSAVSVISDMWECGYIDNLNLGF